MSYSSETEAPELEGISKDASVNELAEEAVTRGCHILDNVNRFKQPRLDQIQKYRNLYAGKVQRKYRQPFNVVLPVFSGMLDTLMAAFNDDLALEFKEQEPADYLKVRKLNTLWQMETNSTAPTAKFPLKTRWDRANALFSGRGFMMNYAVSEPSYKNIFEVFELEDAIFQPHGGGHLESHLFSGRQNIIRSTADLKKMYDKDQVAKLLRNAAQTDFYPFDDENTKAALAKYKAMGLNAEDASYVGEPLFKLAEMMITMNGTRYHLVFSPWYKCWLRFDKLKESTSSELVPWVSWATHEDNKNFITKSFADDLYGMADAIHTLFNQELTNREKKNFHARAYDRDMFTDVAKLDQAQTRPDALVPVDTKQGTRRISDGIYTFETPQLTGTVNLIEWMQQETGRDIGTTDLSMGGVQQASKKASVVFAEQQNITKRLLLRSSPYTEAMAEIGKRFIAGCKDHLPAKKAIRLLGAEGEGWEEITRADLDLYSDADIRVISSSLEMQNSQLKKQARMHALQDIAQNPNELSLINPHWIVEEKLRSGGEYEDYEIDMAMDLKNYGNKEEVAEAHVAIQEIRAGRKPDLYHGATTLFMEIIHTFSTKYRSKIGDELFLTFQDYIQAHAEIAQENMVRKAQNEPGGNPTGPEAPQPNNPTPAPLPDSAPNPMADVQKVAANMI